MIIAFGADHGGVQLKAALLEYARGEGHTVIDCGTTENSSVDYPDFAKVVTTLINARKAERGVLICTTGVGMSMAANKARGIRAALVCNEQVAALSRKHNDTNVICFGALYTDVAAARKMLHIWLNTGFEGGRHQRRIAKLESSEE
ncbi:MAG TPA: ribose 5-phosphate isomerase B [Candidatus Marinimicrobia bacterium]|nr:ribose 5-phosphate isomerase B [Candidatus Neomarinimicrobiota bacterium]